MTDIKNDAFYGCNSLTDITVSENNTVYKSVDGNLYSKDGQILIQYAKGKTAGEYIIPDTVTTIMKNAVSSCCNIKSVTIGNGVVNIGSDAFNGCTDLTSINYKGTKTEWQAIRKGNFWQTNVPSNCVVHCTDGDLEIR